MPAHSGGELFHSRLSTRSVFHIVAKQTFQALDDGGVFFDLKRGSSILAQFFQSRFLGARWQMLFLGPPKLSEGGVARRFWSRFCSYFAWWSSFRQRVRGRDQKSHSHPRLHRHPKILFSPIPSPFFPFLFSPTQKKV